MLCPVQFCFFRKWQTLKNNAYASILFQIGKIGAECSIWFSAETRNGMTSVKDAEYSECLPTGRMYRNVKHISRIWHESRCITIHKLANELGSLMVYAIKFWHVIDCVKISALYTDWWAETIRVALVHTRTLRRNVRHNTSFQRSLQMTSWDLPAWSRQRHLFLCEILTDVSFDEHGSCVMKNNLKNGAVEIDFSTTVLPLLAVVCLA